jgi:hypothetical protein
VRSSTSSTISTGVLLLLITVLLINRVVRVRQLRDRAQVTAAQAAIIAGQARRAVEALRSAAKGDGDRDVASDEIRTYMTMLLISAPVLIDARESRAYLERAQWLAAILAAGLRASGEGPISDELQQRLRDASDGLRDSVQPLLARLGPDQREAVRRAQATGQSDEADADQDGAEDATPAPDTGAG